MDTNVTLLREFSELYDYKFTHGRERHDFFNLIDGNQPNDPQIKIFHWTDKITPIQTSETGIKRGTLYSGAMFILLQSNFDTTIEDDKYDNFVKPIIDEEIDAKLLKFFCKDYVFLMSGFKEVYNLFDMNADGLWGNYTLRIE